MMELFKERLKESAIMFFLIVFFASLIIGIMFEAYWVLMVWITILVILMLSGWIHWQFIEPYKVAKAEKENKEL